MFQYLFLFHSSSQPQPPGVTYEVVVVAYTITAGEGTENDYITFFSKELQPTKSPENVNFKQLNLTSLNDMWTPLTLFEAQGFPEYRVVLTVASINCCQKRLSNPPPVITTNSFTVFTDLNENTDYAVVVGVRTRSVSEFVDGNRMNGKNMY